MTGIMKKDTVRFYRTEALANAALARFIAANSVVEAQQVTFSDDDYCHDFEFIGMEEREWYGWMCGIKVTTAAGEMVTFASWDEPDEECNGPEEYFNKALGMFVTAMMN